MKQIQGSVRVKIKECGPSLFSLPALFVIFNFFPQINHFYYFTSLHGLQDVENHCAHLRDIELQTGRKIPYLRFPMYFSHRCGPGSVLSSDHMWAKSVVGSFSAPRGLPPGTLVFPSPPKPALLNSNLTQNAQTLNTWASGSGEGATTPCIIELKHLIWFWFWWMKWNDTK